MRSRVMQSTRLIVACLTDGAVCVNIHTGFKLFIEQNILSEDPAAITKCHIYNYVYVTFCHQCAFVNCFLKNRLLLQGPHKWHIICRMQVLQVIHGEGITYAICALKASTNISRRKNDKRKQLQDAITISITEQRLHVDIHHYHNYSSGSVTGIM